METEAKWDRATLMRSLGYWSDEVLTDFFDKTLRVRPDATAVLGHNSVTDRSYRLTFAELDEQASYFATLLETCGIEKGDIVSVQLPNWWQFFALHLACLRLGAITNPLVMTLRKREISFILENTRAKVFVTCGSFRNYDHAAVGRDMRRSLPSLHHVLCIEGGEIVLDGGKPWRQTTAERWRGSRMDADDTLQILYTSGTTGEPKGVIHSSNTLMSTLRGYTNRMSLTKNDVVLMGSPLAHQTGFMYGMMVPLMLGCRAVLMDVWSGQYAAEIIAHEGVTYTMGSTPFLSDLADEAKNAPGLFGTLRVFHAAGATIPRHLARQASIDMGAAICSGWGMTENGAVTTTIPSDPEEKVFNTDGCCVPGMEIRVVDDARQPCPTNAEGHLQTRGCANLLGYLGRPDIVAIDAEGWFETGDLARIDQDGYLRITGRTKDIIIRGGENVPVVEIENLLFAHPHVREVAIVGIPHDRLGEQALAVIVPAADKQPTLADLTDFLLTHNVSRTYLPEHLQLVENLPKTPSGKVQKFALRHNYQDEVAG